MSINISVYRYRRISRNRVL